MPPGSGLLAILRALAEREGVNWESLESNHDEPRFLAVARELQVVDEIAKFHRTLQESPDPAVSSSRPGGPAVNRLSERALDQPASWGPLTLLEHVGQGSFADVYRARDRRLDREVALKLLRERHATADHGDWALREARLLAKVRHPNVVTVHGAEQIDGQVGIWTEFIQGQTLADLVRQQGPFGADEATAVGIDLCRALAAVHQAGLLHRDIKAQNVMREHGGRIVLMDLGAGRELVATTMAAGGGLTGTPLYLAPEVWQGADATPQTDLYSLGVLLYHLVTGNYPVRGATIQDMRGAHRACARTLLRDARPHLPHAFVDVVEQALATDPSRRYDSAGAFETALRQAHSASAAVPLVTNAESAARHRPPVSTIVRRSAIALAAIIALVSSAWLLDAGGMRSRWQATPASTSSSASADLDAASTHRKIRLPQRPMGRPSRDGRYFPYVDPNGDLQVWEVPTGHPRRLVEKTPGDTVAAPVMAPRGDRVTYTVSTAAGGSELRVVNADGTWPSVLLAHQTAYTPVPLDWSRDEQSILCRLDQRDGTADLVLVAARGGPPRVLQTFKKQSPSHASLSPDGRFVVYRLRADARGSREDIFIVGVDGSPARLLVAGRVENPYSYDRAPVWTPDGKHVLFLRESATVRESQDAWMIPVVDGMPQGDPFTVLTNLGGAAGIGLTDEGALFYMIASSSAEVYTASIDLTGDVIRGEPSRISPTNIGRHRAPAWSPDGASIAYYAEHANPIPGFVPSMSLVVQDVASGAERTLTPRVASVDSYAPRWTVDSRSVILRAREQETKRPGLFRVDVRTSETDIVAWTDQNPPYFECSPNGRDFLYVDARGIVSLDLSSGRERVVVPRGVKSSVGPFGISPEGGAIAFVRRTAVDGGETVALEVQSIGGPPRELVRVKPPNDLRFQMWTPDGQDILYTQWTGPVTSAFPLWRIAAKGGEPRDTHFAFAGAINLGSLSPDGRRVAYTERELFWELWIDETPLQALRGRAVERSVPSLRPGRSD